MKMHQYTPGLLNPAANFALQTRALQQQSLKLQSPPPSDEHKCEDGVELSTGAAKTTGQQESAVPSAVASTTKEEPAQTDQEKRAAELAEKRAKFNREFSKAQPDEDGYLIPDFNNHHNGSGVQVKVTPKKKSVGVEVKLLDHGDGFHLTDVKLGLGKKPSLSVKFDF